MARRITGRRAADARYSRARAPEEEHPLTAREVPIHVVDAFTSEPFAGNPAAVCLLEDARSDRWLQAVAAEMNLSETAFLWREGPGYRLRWFTPTVEVPLCGHATLASAHLLFESGQAAGDELRFATKSGELRAVRQGGAIELDFPAFRYEPTLLPVGGGGRPRRDARRDEPRREAERRQLPGRGRRASARCAARAPTPARCSPPARRR